VPTTGRAEVVIGVGGPVQVQDFTLRGPDKIVVDITGATLGLPPGNYYDNVARGGIVNVRYSQFRRNVVRIVLTLDAAHHYTVARTDGEVRVSVDGPAGSFVAWHVGDSEPALAHATVSVATDVSPVPQPVRPTVEQAGNPELQAHVVSSAAHSRSLTAITPSVLPEMKQRQQQPRITIQWEKADIHDVLAAFAAFSGRTIIPSKDVSGTVTAEITNQPWDVALRAILNANGFDATEDPTSGIIIVDTYEHIAARQAAEPMSTRTIRLNYARAYAVAPMVAQRLTRDCRAGAPGAAPGGEPAAAGGATAGAPALPAGCTIRGTVTPDSLTNSISITDVPTNLDELEAYAKSVDIRQPQVNIKAKIILVDRTNLEALGLRYDLGTRDQFFNDIIPRVDSTGAPLTTGGQFALGGNAVAAIANASQRIPGAALQLLYSTAMGGYTLSSWLEALQQLALLDVQAEPSATVLNNFTANLTAGTTVPIRVIDAGTGGAAGGNFPRSNVTFRQVGVILQVTPQITANRQVQMKVHVENSDVQFQSSDVGAVFPTQYVDNQVLVADGETAVMGGLTQTTVRLTKSGIPILVDLPLIGRLFGVTNRQETKRDLLILLTPHIVDEGGQPPQSR
jgi:type IV pilus assembly protein PilQ